MEILSYINLKIFSTYQSIYFLKKFIKLTGEGKEIVPKLIQQGNLLIQVTY